MDNPCLKPCTPSDFPRWYRTKHYYALLLLYKAEWQKRGYATYPS